jgi:enamine deaminase RidA (YjgF/YER057c/UK114 family)
MKTNSITFSLIPFGSSSQLFLTVLPKENYQTADDTQGHGKTTDDWAAQIRNILENTSQILQENGFDNNIAVSNFFLKDIGKKELVRQIISEVFPADVFPNGFGASTFIPQSPAGGSAVSLELWAIKGGSVDSKAVDGKTNNGKTLPFVSEVEFDGLRWVFAGDARPEALPAGAYQRSYSAFEQLRQQLNSADTDFSQTLRTWIYQGHLVLPEGQTQRYKELNRARTDFFKGIDFLKDYLPQNNPAKSGTGAVYPASTGIGTDDMDIVISAVAVAQSGSRKEKSGFLTVPLENPHQTSAFDYGTSYSPQSPKFSRALAAVHRNSCMIFVSGTASITDSESRFIEDPEKQTEQTLDNIAALIDTENLNRHGIDGFVSALSDLQVARVYVKRPAELDIIRKVCERRLKNVPVLYVIADVCRPELLVEIEGIAVINR